MTYTQQLLGIEWLETKSFWEVDNETGLHGPAAGWGTLVGETATNNPWRAAPEEATPL